MKITLLQRRAAVLFVAFIVPLPHAGCRAGKQSASAHTCAGEGSIDSRNDALPEERNQSRVEVLVHYVEQPNPFSFRVENQNLGVDVPEMIRWLANRGVTDVIVESEYKLTPERVRDLVNQINHAGIVVKEFWIPRSTPPGRIEFLSGD